MFHAKQLAGGLGIDLSMLGFADLLSGGLGEGGFFRVSAQVAERSRMIRNAVTSAINDIIEIHLYKKSGLAFSDNDRPWAINFYSGISAAQKESNDTKLAAMNTGGILIQTLAQLKTWAYRLMWLSTYSHKMMLDEDSAELVANGLNAAKAQADSEQGGDNGDFDTIKAKVQGGTGALKTSMQT